MTKTKKSLTVANKTHKNDSPPQQKIQVTHLIQKTSVILALIGLITAFNLFIFSLPRIGIGLWPQSETAIAILHACSALCGASLLIRLATRNSIPRALKHPFVLIPAAIGLLSLLLLPFHILPMRSLLGSVRIGESPLSWFGLSLLTASAITLWRIKFYRSILIAAALTGFIVSFALSVSHTHFKTPYTPFFFADYLAFDVIALLPITYVALTKKLNKTALFLTLYALLNILFYTTENRFMMAYGLTAPLFFFLFWKLPLTDSRKKQFEVFTLLAIPFVGMAGFLSLTQIGNINSGFYDFTDISIMQTVASRAYLMDTALRPLLDNPLTFITGNGWSSFVEHIPRYLPLEWLNLTDQDIVQWDGLTTDHFHSHNMFLETLNCIGIIGLALLIAYITSFYLYAKTPHKKPALLFSVGFGAWASSWFFMPPNWPFIAFAAASLSKGVYWRVSKNRTFTAITLTAILTLQAFGSFVIHQTAWNTANHSSQSLEISDANTFQDTCPTTYNDFGAGGFHLSKMLLSRLRYTIHLTQEEGEGGKKAKAESKPEEPIEPHIKELNHVFCEANFYLNTHESSARLKVARLIARGEILLGLSPYLTEEEKQYYYAGWKENLEAWLNDMPERSDQAIPFLLYHIITQQEYRSQPIIRTIRDRRPEDPVGLWFNGLNLLNDPRKAQEGLKMMKQSLNNGIERYMPIEKPLLEMLK